MVADLVESIEVAARAAISGSDALSLFVKNR